MNSKNSIIKKYTSVEDYINHCFEDFKLKNPKLTKRQINIQLQDNWKKEQAKHLSKHPKKEESIIIHHDESEEIYIPIEAINNETQNKQKKNKKTSKKYKKKSQNLSKSIIVKKHTDSPQQSFDIHSLEERMSNIQIDIRESSKTKPSKKLRIQQQLNTTNVLIKNNKCKAKCKKQKKVAFKQDEKIQKNLIGRNAPDEKPIPIQDFINSANFIDHISIIKIQKNKTNQGQIEVDKVKSINSHTYGLVNHYKDTSNLNLQLFFQVEFHPRPDGTYPDDTFCTAKQVALYNKDLVLDYLNKNKSIFTQDSEYYIN
ncbi:unnamed protein product (macronuclear) [Paramecium tetraurelia]|uniref:Uncharacterized protein n=1 Tax=Paramecium tetraurelia TaxID=5888 RepID=A0CH06_PARTE|nr:uncharacterized protein GSPATT00007513001 [Paramecium tetraurelia]CAK70073.1 unnamed protein product [Paramecium tetraurelia]|eukprot:XP_001437470.1 hypothetical protein (macronuclear) [Paramecium tetraurelia strain d4-2]